MTNLDTKFISAPSHLHIVAISLTFIIAKENKRESIRGFSTNVQSVNNWKVPVNGSIIS